MLVDRIDALLPQTQCTRCGYAGCRPYAQALADGQTDINRCPPGGQAGVAALAALLHRPARPLDPDCGEHQPLARAVVIETHCIGCTLCVQACPVDAIIGANKRMHTVLADRCTGCELCLAPCPVDCIRMEPVGHAWTTQHAQRARQHYHQRNARLAAESDGQDGPGKAQAHSQTSSQANNQTNKQVNTLHKQAMIADALARARARRQAAQRARPA